MRHVSVRPVTAIIAMRIPKTDIKSILPAIVVMTVRIPARYGPMHSPMLIAVSYEAIALPARSSGK